MPRQIYINRILGSMPTSTKATIFCHQYHQKKLPTFAIFSSSELRKSFICDKTISYDVITVHRSN